MEKVAQKRSILNKLKEVTNISGQAAEKFFNPEFQKVMESLREKDNMVRAVIAGQEIDGADPGPDPISLKELLKSAKSNFNRREYMTTVSELGRFHKKLFDAQQVIKSLEVDVDQVHHEFLFKDLGDEHKKQLEDLKKRFANSRQQELIKEAGIMDFFHNIGTQRGRALAAWEKRYPKQIGKLKKDTSLLLSKSEMALTTTLSSLKEMAAARASRNVDNYMKAADKIVKAYQNYDKLFKEYYINNIKGFLEKVELTSPVEKNVDSKEMGKQEIPVENKDVSNLPIPLISKEPEKSVVLPSGTAIPSPFAPTALTPSAKTPTIPPAAPVPSIDTAPPSSVSDTEASPPPNMEEKEEYPSDRLAKEMWGKSEAHTNFLNSLIALSQESPLILAAHIRKYAQKIQNDNPQLAIQLFQIVKNIKG